MATPLSAGDSQVMVACKGPARTSGAPTVSGTVPGTSEDVATDASEAPTALLARTMNE